MTDLTTTVSLSGIGSVQYNDSNGLLYISDSTGLLRTWNPLTATFGASATLNAPPGAFDITADGAYALVNEQGAIDRVNLSTLAVTHLAFPNPSPFMGNQGGIATTKTGLVLTTDYYSLSGGLNLYEFNALASSATAGAVGGDFNDSSLGTASLASSEDHRYVLINGQNDKPLEVYDSTSNMVTVSTDYFNLGAGDISSSAGLIVEWSADALYIFTLGLAEQNLIEGAQVEQFTAAKFSADGHQLYAVDHIIGSSSPDQLLVFDTARLASLGIPSTLAGSPALIGSMTLSANLANDFAVQMSESSNGKLLFINNGSSFGVVDLASDLHLNVQGDATHTTLYGGAGADTISGSAANDILYGNGGSDILTGGAGSDTFVFSTNTGNSTITDFSHTQGDHIDLSAFTNWAALSDVLSGLNQVGANAILTLPNGGAITLDNTQASTLTASDFVLSTLGSGGSNGSGGGANTGGSTAAETFVVSPHRGTDTIADFSHAQGDRIDLRAFTALHAILDIQQIAHQQGSDTVIDLGGGTSVTLAGVQLASLTGGDFILQPADTHLSYDFNHDGTADMLFRDPVTSDWGYAAMTNHGYDWHDLGTSGASYLIGGVGDFNGDGRPDVVFRDPTTGDWGFSAGNASGGFDWNHIGNSGVNYSVAGSGDFDGDHVTDVLFRDAGTGDWGYDAMIPGQAPVWHHLGNSGANFEVAGTGDFDGDGITDALFRDPTTGEWGYEAMQKGANPIWHYLGNSGLTYTVAGTGDFDGDGIADVLFRDPATGDWGYDQMQKGAAPIWHHLGNSTVAYTVGGIGDFDGDGKADVAFINTQTGDWGYTSHMSAGGDWHHMGVTSIDHSMG